MMFSSCSGKSFWSNQTRSEAVRRALGTRLQKLPEEQRQLVQAAYAPGVKIDGLAAHMGRTAMALYKTLHRIRLTLTGRHPARDRPRRNWI